MPLLASVTSGSSAMFSESARMMDQFLPFAIFGVAMLLGFVVSYRKEMTSDIE